MCHKGFTVSTWSSCAIISGMARTPGESHAFWRLRPLRRARALTLEDLAKRTGLTKSYLSKVERGTAGCSIATAFKLARAFDFNVGELFGLDAASQDYAVVRKEQRKSFSRKGQTVEAIAPGLNRSLFQAFVMHPRRSPGRLPPRVRHSGQELIFVLKGSMAVSFPHDTIKLSEGDSLVFNGELPHQIFSIGAHAARALVVITNEKAGSD
jgi:transcriptional regulator with XRE-family HTH domain